jgi:bacterial/archaeal transporter family protein
MPHFPIPPWCWPAAAVLLSWGVGLLQKLSTNFISAESALIWLVMGYVLLLPWLRTSTPISSYPVRSIVFVLASAVLNTLGVWALLRAMANGDKASIVVPLTAVYPVVVVISAPVILHESITLMQSIAVLCALTSVVLLSTE